MVQMFNFRSRQTTNQSNFASPGRGRRSSGRGAPSPDVSNASATGARDPLGLQEPVEMKRTKSGGFFSRRSSAASTAARAQAMSAMLEQNDFESLQRESPAKVGSPSLNMTSAKEAAKKFQSNQKTNDDARDESFSGDNDSFRKQKRLTEQKRKQSEGSKKKNGMMVYAVHRVAAPFRDTSNTPAPGAQTSSDEKDNASGAEVVLDQNGHKVMGPTPTDEQGNPLYSSVFSKKTNHERNEFSKMRAAQMLYESEMNDDDKDGVKIIAEAKSNTSSTVTTSSSFSTSFTNTIYSRLASPSARSKAFQQDKAAQQQQNNQQRRQQPPEAQQTQGKNHFGYLPSTYRRTSTTDDRIQAKLNAWQNPYSIRQEEQHSNPRSRSTSRSQSNTRSQSNSRSQSTDQNSRLSQSYDLTKSASQGASSRSDVLYNTYLLPKKEEEENDEEEDFAHLFANPNSKAPAGLLV
mmetsp:Transcript_8047/g.12430  ORF Transcript_8047/g.12430 Transcript_8047/m.12430 type:complete len:462 (+) Transcript_8047:19-1404(+)